MSDKKEVALKQPDSASLIQVIERVAMNPDADIEKMKELMNMKFIIDDREAEKQFNIAMSKAQSKMECVATDSVNEHTKSRYAKHEAIAKAIKPIYTKEGLSITFSEGDSPKEKYIRIIGILRHKAGHSETHYIDLPIDVAGIGGTKNKTEIHGTGSTISYGRRYLTCMIFDIATGDDDDGNAAGAPPPETITKEQATYLHALMTDNNLNQSAIMGWLKADVGCNTFSELYMHNFAIVERRIKSAIRAQNKETGQ